MNEVPFIDTSIVPDRNAGIGSLLWDLQHSQGSDNKEQPLLSPEFAFIDVGISRASVSTILKTLLAQDLRMNIEYVATELPEAVPYAYITPTGVRAEQIRKYLNIMIATKESTREVMDWHYVVDQTCKVSSIAYSYNYYGNEVWESYFMGRPFMISGEKVEFRDPTLDELLAYDVQKIEEMIHQERKQNSEPNQPAPAMDGYRREINPLETGLAAYGITLQKTNTPIRVKNRQNVLFLGNILNLFPRDQQAHELYRIATNMQEKDLVIVQADETDASYIGVFCVKGRGEKRKFDRLIWINTIKLEIERFNADGSSQKIHLKPVLAQVINYLIECLGTCLTEPMWSQDDNKLLIQQNFNQVFRAFFRGLPVEETLRIAIRETLRRLPIHEALNGIPIFRDDTVDIYGGPLGLNTTPIVSEADLSYIKKAQGTIERKVADKIQ